MMVSLGISAEAFHAAALPTSRLQRQSPLAALPVDLVGESSSLSFAVSSVNIAEGETTWRQYVSLALIAGVLLDIVLGSPLANTLLKPMRGEDEADSEVEEGIGRAADPGRRKSKERIDSEQVAQAALDKAQNALELKRFLDESKTDWDRMEEMKRKLDARMDELDEDLAAREETLAQKRKNADE